MQAPNAPCFQRWRSSFLALRTMHHQIPRTRQRSCAGLLRLRPGASGTLHAVPAPPQLAAPAPALSRLPRSARARDPPSPHTPWAHIVEERNVVSSETESSNQELHHSLNGKF